ncbi:MAG: AEC family transporter [Lachnospiraceae bacterium]|nr:AEC family transporter [Lachnospiraceae bacterium]
MDLSLILLKQIMVIAIMIIFGFAAGKAKVLTLENSATISKLILYIIAPCMTLSALQLEYSSEKAIGFALAVVCAIVYHIIMIAGTRWFAPILKLKTVESASIIYTNAGNLLIPIIGYVLGSEYVFYCCAYSVVQTVLFWTHLVSMMSGQKQMNVKKIILNPNIIACIVGLLLFFSRITFPEILGSALSRTGDCVGPMSMVVIGIMIADADLKKIFSQKDIWIVTILRLIISPLLTAAVLGLLVNTIIPKSMISVLFVFFLATAAPSASTVSQMANLEHKDEVLAGSINIMTVVLCILTMPLMTAVFQALVR